MLKQLMLWITMFFRLHAEGDDPPQDNQQLDDELQAIIDEETPPSGDEPPADEQPPDGDEPPPRESRENEAIRAARERAQQAEQREREARAEADRLRAEQTQRSAGPTAEQRQWDEEEARLRDPATDEQTRYWITANRRLRASEANATAARAEVADTKDFTAFSRLSTHQNPVVQKLYHRYADEVEAEYTKLRSQGQTVPRQAIMAILHQRDIVNGKFQPKKKASTSANADTTQRRQQQTGARSDVSSKQRQTERDKRRARLEGVNI